MDPAERAARDKILKEVIERNTPSKWVWHQLNDIERLHES
jgi:hypothetical protein